MYTVAYICASTKVLCYVVVTTDIVDACFATPFQLMLHNPDTYYREDISFCQPIKAAQSSLPVL